MKKIRNLLITGLAGISLGIGASYLFAATGGPTDTPPKGNLDAPITALSGNQTIAGSLTVNTGSSVNGLIVPRGAILAQGSGALVTPPAGLKVVTVGKMGADKYCDQTNTNCIDPASAGGSGGVDDLPVGTVSMFDTPSCPAGWASFGALAGRFPRGVANGSTLTGQVGYKCPTYSTDEPNRSSYRVACFPDTTASGDCNGREVGSPRETCRYKISKDGRGINCRDFGWSYAQCDIALFGQVPALGVQGGHETHIHTFSTGVALELHNSVPRNNVDLYHVETDAASNRPPSRNVLYCIKK